MKPMNMLVRSLTPLVLLACVVALAGCRSEQPVTADANAPSQTSGAGTAPGGGAPPPRRDIPAAPTIRTVPAGTTMHLRIEDSLASNSNHRGDRFQARVLDDVFAENAVVIPAGSVVGGVVSEARALKTIGGRALLHLEFTHVVPPSGEVSQLRASYEALGNSETKKDAATIGGSAVGGAILGRVIGAKKGEEAKGTAIGGAVGAAAGTAVAAATKGHEIVLPAGAVIQISLREPAHVTLRS